MTVKPQDGVGLLLVRDGCYAVQVHLLYGLAPGAKLIQRTHICGEVPDPVALFADTLVLAGTGHLPEGVMMFSIEKSHERNEI